MVALQVLVPSARVTLLPLFGLRRAYATAGALHAALDAFDHVFAQPFAPGFMPPGDANAAAAIEARASLYPTIVFPAFHPDMVYVGDLRNLAEASLVPSPLGHYHSAIALQGFLSGLTEAQTVALYREEVFARLGYFDGWTGAAGDLLRGGEAIGFPLERELLRWTRRGAFMHVLNHPKLFVLGDLARRLAEGAGFAPQPIEVDDYLADDLARDVVWPVYAPIAEHYGIAGSYTFKGKPRGSGPPPLYDLSGLVAASFAIYRAEPRARLTCPRIDAWTALPDADAIFAAGRA